MKSSKKSIYVPSFLFLLVLAFFSYDKYSNYFARQQDLVKKLRVLEIDHQAKMKVFKTNGDGRLLKELFQMPPTKRTVMVKTIGLNDCNFFIAFVTNGEERKAEEEGIDPIVSLDLSLELPTKSRLIKLQGVNADEVWEGLKEINSLLSQIKDNHGQMDLGFRDPTIGSIASETVGMNKKELENYAKAVSEKTAYENEVELQAVNNRTNQLELLGDQITQIAALELSRVPASQRPSVLELKISKEGDNLYNRQ